jgi:hypothetical protein
MPAITSLYDAPMPLAFIGLAIAALLAIILCTSIFVYGCMQMCKTKFTINDTPPSAPTRLSIKRPVNEFGTISAIY